MKKEFWFIVVVLLAAMMTSCTLVERGEMGIVFDLYGDSKGIETKAQGAGMVGYNPFTQKVIKYPTTIYKVEYTGDEAIQFASKEGTQVTVPIAIQVYSDLAGGPKLYGKYKEHFEALVDNQLHMRVRDHFNAIAVDYSVQDIYSDKRNELIKKVFDNLQAEWNEQGLYLSTISYLGKPIFPEAIQKAIDDKTKMEQDTQTAILNNARAQADAESRVTTALGEAKANKILSDSITPNIIRIRELQNQEKFIAALAEGKATMPATYVTSGNQTLIPLK